MSTTKIRIQLGLELRNGAVRKARLTPVDHTSDVPNAAAQALLLIAGVADMADMEPGDGEVDVNLGELDTLAKQASTPGLIRDLIEHANSAGYGGRTSVFIRIRRVE